MPKHKKKILFIALAQSSHTHEWVNLVSKSKYEVRIFGVENSWAERNIKCYGYSFSRNYPYSEIISPNIFHKFVNYFTRAIAFWRKNYLSLEGEWMVRIIKKWQPDIVHTLGIDPTTIYFWQAMHKYKIKKKFSWVVTIRGGSDLELERLIPEKKKIFQQIFQQCDWVIADNPLTYQYAFSLGLEKEKRAFEFLPGTGGIDIEKMLTLRKIATVKSRIILWPKACEAKYSKGLPVLEALKIAWDKIKPCKIVMTAVDDEFLKWLNLLPLEIKKSIQTYERIERDQLLKIMAQARVVLLPSLIDGIPNALYEAMAAKALPIVSPLPTIKTKISQTNVLFARNLYPQEIATALVKAMNDDKLVDKVVKNNLRLVRRIADRKKIIQKVNEYYDQT